MPPAGTAPPSGAAAFAASIPRTSMSAVTIARLSLGVVALTLGAFGVHKFILGRNLEGLIMLFVTLLTCFAISPVIWIIGIIEGIIYLLKSDREFEQDYLIGAKGWF